MTSTLKGAACAAAVLLVACTTAPAPSVERGPSLPITKAESRELPADAVKERVLDQLADLLIPDPPLAPSARPKRPLSELVYWTVPRNADVTGACETDRVTFRFAPVDEGDKGAATPVRIVDVYAHPYFHFTSDVDIVEMYSDVEDEPDCASISPIDVEYIRAASAEIAADALYKVRQAATLAREGAAGLEVECTFLKDAAGDECRTIIASADPRRVYRVEDCDTYPSDHGGLRCTRVYETDYRISIFGEYRSTKAPVRAVVDELILLYHPQPD